MRPMEEKDVASVTQLLTASLKKYQIKRVFTEEEVRFLLNYDSAGKIMYAFVIEDENGAITDFFSFYSVPKITCRRFSQEVDHLKSIYQYYYADGKNDIKTLVKL